MSSENDIGRLNKKYCSLLCDLAHPNIRRMTSYTLLKRLSVSSNKILK